MPRLHLSIEEMTDDGTLTPAIEHPDETSQQQQPPLSAIATDFSQKVEHPIDETNQGGTDSYSDGLLFSSKCESQSTRPIITLLSCLRNITQTSSGYTKIGSGSCLYSASDKTSSVGNSAEGQGRSKVQFATVLVTEKSLVFRVHGIQSLARVELQVFSVRLTYRSN